MIMVAAASLYGLILTREQVPAEAADLISQMTDSPLLLLFLIVLLYLVAGAILDLGANIIILVPVLYPMVLEFNIFRFYFGIITIVALAIGLVTPPVGICLFVASSIAGISIAAASRAVVPLFCAACGPDADHIRARYRTLAPEGHAMSSAKQKQEVQDMATEPPI